MIIVMPESLHTIFDHNRRLRFNVYPFERQNNYERIIVQLPSVRNGDTLCGPFEDVEITRLRLFLNYGALSHERINSWLIRNEFIRDGVNAPIHVFLFDQLINGDTLTITITRYCGIRLPRQPWSINDGCVRAGL